MDGRKVKRKEGIKEGRMEGINEQMDAKGW